MGAGVTRSFASAQDDKMGVFGMIEMGVFGMIKEGICSRNVSEPCSAIVPLASTKISSARSRSAIV